MNKLSLALIFLTVLTACDTNERCVANCDEGTGSTSEGGSSTTAEESDGDPTGEAVLTCEDATALAHAYIAEHRGCETMLDCELPSRAVCLPDADIPGVVSLSIGGFFSDEWDDIDGALDELCPCEAPDSASSICNEEDECHAVDTPGEFCGTVLGDVETFRAANTSCNTNADCVAVESACYVDDCSIVALNTEASTIDWQRLDNAGTGCNFLGCNFAGDCAAEVECSDEGMCVTVL